MIKKYLNRAIPDLIYRLVLWIIFAISLQKIADVTSGIGNGYIQAAAKILPNPMYWNVLVGSGVLTCLINIVAKDALQNSSVNISGKISKFISDEFIYLMSKASSDFLLAGYNVCAYFIGLMLYYYSDVSIGQGIAPKNSVLLSMFSLLAFIGVLSLIARADIENDKYVGKWIKETRLKNRIYFYMILFIVVIFLFFSHKPPQSA